MARLLRGLKPELQVQANHIMDRQSIVIQDGSAGVFFGSWGASKALMNMPLPANMEGRAIEVVRIEVNYAINGTNGWVGTDDPYNYVRMGIILDKTNVPSASVQSDNTIVSTAIDTTTPFLYYNPQVYFDGSLGSPQTLRKAIGKTRRQHMKILRDRTHLLCSSDPLIAVDPGTGAEKVAPGWAAGVGRPFIRRKIVLNFRKGLRMERSSTRGLASTDPFGCINGAVPHIFFISDSGAVPHPVVNCWTYVFFRDI